ncbi:cation:dicarboxylate symporter family transporter [Streptomyces sp. NRRL F-5135]|uniref:cation:dicarboxylate symporter family transporter n=1 Tax=Streptomyces sp. NRRL F-5135 TaxID=1463858 RepID=UPI00099DDA80|nr:cation:dicarboxylase symporter family transporter [Streptomyces sp. NRRL F-5135]
MRSQEQLLDAASPPAARKRWYRGLGAQVVVAMALGIVVGLVFPGVSADLKIVGDLFLALVKAGVAPLVFFTIVMGIASAGDLKKASRVGFLALIYFEVVSTLALLLGLLAANLFGVGKGVELAPDAASSAQAPKAEGGEHGFTAFLKDIVPDNFIGAFSSGQLLQVVVLAVLFGVGLLGLKPYMRDKVNAGLEVVSETFFGFVNVVMKLAPIGTFGAVAYSVGTNGSDMLLALTELVLEYWLVIGVFVFGVLGLVCLLAGFNILRILDIAPVLGRQRAHEVVYEACRAAIETGTSLETQLLDHADLVDRLGADRIGQLCDPARYLGSAATMTRMVINSPARELAIPAAERPRCRGPGPRGTGPSGEDGTAA